MPTDQELIKIVPSKRQLKYQETEFYAFFHFGMNTYTNREWGDGTEGYAGACDQVWTDDEERYPDVDRRVFFGAV